MSLEHAEKDLHFPFFFSPKAKKESSGGLHLAARTFHYRIKGTLVEAHPATNTLFSMDHEGRRRLL